MISIAARPLHPNLLQAARPAANQTGVCSAVGSAQAKARGVALAISLLLHAGIATLALRQARASGTPSTNPNAPAELESYIEVSAPDPANAAVVSRTSVPAPAPARVAQRATSSSAQPSAAEEYESPANAKLGSAPPTPVVASAAANAPRFALTAATVTGFTAKTAAEHPGVDARSVSGPAVVEPISEGAADIPAKLVWGTPPSYTGAAEAAGVEADVPLEIVIDGTGSVLGARSLRHVGYGLDEVALSAVRSYRFSPAHRGGKAVAIRMHWSMRFQLR